MNTLCDVLWVDSFSIDVIIKQIMETLPKHQVVSIAAVVAR